MYKKMNQTSRKSFYAWQLSQVSWSSKGFSEETSTAKELLLLILQLCGDASKAKGTGFVPSCATKEKEKENIMIFTKIIGELLTIISK